MITMRTNPFASDVGILTEEELLYVEQKVIETFRYQLQARKLFPIRSVPDAKFYRFYDEEDPSGASITMDGKAQSDDFPEKTAHDLKWPVISKEFLLNWRDIDISRRQGPSILDDSIRTATRMVAQTEDRLLISGETAGWPALGVEGLFTATGRNTDASAGNWPANSVADVNAAVALLEADGFVGVKPIMVGPPALISCLDGPIANTGITYRSFLLNNNLISGTISTPNAFTAAGGVNSVVLVIPGEDNFYAMQGVPLMTRLWEDKAGNVHGTVRENIVPVIGRPTAICETTAIVCA